MCGPLVAKQLRVHSDGTDRGTAFITEDGETLDRVSEATIRMEVGEPISVELTVLMPIVNTSAQVGSIDFRCPMCEDSFTHECVVPMFGASSTAPAPRCEGAMQQRDPFSHHRCIREWGHDKKHFDGEVCWDDD